MQRFSQTVKTTFSKGLITEASEMAFPEEASVDELNVDLTRKGTRRRRLGVKIEDNDLPSTEVYGDNALFQTQTWDNVGGDSSTKYLVLQVGNTLRFYRKATDAVSREVVPTSFSNPAPYIVDLTQFNSETGTGASSDKVTCASIEGHLVVCSPQIDSFYITRNPDGSFTETAIDFKIRDFEYLGDRDDYLTASANLTVPVERQYDTQNAGWAVQNGINPLGVWTAAESTYPALTHPWYSGKSSSGTFNVTEWKKVTSGSSFIGNGHYILDLFNQDRDAASGLEGLPNTIYNKRFSAVASFAGRVFFSGIDSRVYFSRIIEDIDYIGDLYQVNDPTSEYSNDLLDTDGGSIRIPDAHGINKLHVFGASIFVFASNGVWRISGVDDVFRATEFSVSKVTDFGLSVPNSFAEASNNLPFWWSYSGIHTIVVTENGGFREISISRNTVQTLWDEIDSKAKESVTATYDREDDKIVWAYANNDETQDFKLNKFLIFDLGFQAFIPWQVSDAANDDTKIVGIMYFDGSRSGTEELVVVDNNNNTVVDDQGNIVVVTADTELFTNNELKLVVQNDNGTVSFATFSGRSFLDWETEDYSSYLVSSYNFIGDVTRFKNSPYITTLLKITETGIDEGTLVNPSSILISAFWDFSKTSATSPQQGYRLKQIPFGDSTTFNYPNTILQTKLKLRGRGRVVSIRFESETGKDFDLIGWETIDAANPNF